MSTSPLEYLVQRGLLYREAGKFCFTVAGKALYQDKGYLVWLAGGYGHVLHQLGPLLQKKQTYGDEVVRSGHWVAVSSALIGQGDVMPYAWKCLEQLSFTHMLDLGCGNARFLLSVCQSLGCSGVGVDNSREACEEARRVIHNAGLDEKLQIVEADAANLQAIPALEKTQLVSAFFVLHEIFALGTSVIITFLKNLHASLPDKAYFLIGEVAPVLHQGSPTDEWFTPEFGLLHAVMRQSLATEEDWRSMLEQTGFLVREVQPLQVPGTMLILCQSSKQ